MASVSQPPCRALLFSPTLTPVPADVLEASQLPAQAATTCSGLSLMALTAGRIKAGGSGEFGKEAQLSQCVVPRFSHPALCVFAGVLCSLTP